jgi:hypothetical protein
MSDAFLETTFLAFNHVVSFGANCSQALERAMNGKNDAQVLSHHILHVFFRLHHGSSLDWETDGCSFVLSSPQH